MIPGCPLKKTKYVDLYFLADDSSYLIYMSMSQSTYKDIPYKKLSASSA